ncbi:MAG TPA: hypothetical protein VJP40_05300, partial [bacterium]|nr:hypothetical protein [bacterium]
LPIKTEQPEKLAQPELPQSARKAFSQAVPSAATQSQPDRLGVELMRSSHGDSFTSHYYNAWNAAGHVAGREFLDNFRGLKNCAKRQGMSDQDFRDFERCLYRRFYRAASRDSMQRISEGRELKVKPEELAYLAKVGGISAGQLERDALSMRRSQTAGEMKAIVARHGGGARMRGLA